MLPLPPDLMSLILASNTAEGSWEPRISPLFSTARFKVGELLLSAAAARSSMLFDLMYSVISLLDGKPTACVLDGAVAVPSRASLIRTSTAAEGFLAVPKSPRERTFRWTSGGQSRKSAEARSSILLDRKNSSTSSFVGPLPSSSAVMMQDVAEASEHQLCRPDWATNIHRGSHINGA